MKKIILSVSFIALLSACTTAEQVPFSNTNGSVDSNSKFYSGDNNATSSDSTKGSYDPEGDNVVRAKSSTDVNSTQNVPSSPVYKVGDPYKIDGVWYFPYEDYYYSEVGKASWYGKDDNGKLTANGETFDSAKLTAAHRTLPLPSIVRVTNVENGKSVVVRVNDRGPYARDRIIDVSEAAAEQLGFKDTGSASVKVEILADESKALKESLQSGTSYDASKDVQAVNAPVEKAVSSTPDVAEPAPVVNVAPTVYNGKSAVQVGVFADANNANKMVARLKNAGYKPTTQKTANGSVKVFADGYSNKAAARSAIPSLESKGFGRGLFVAR